jgi:putative membrane protein
MDRRHVLAGLAGFPLASAAFAQTAQPQSPAAQTGGAAGGVYGTAGVTNANNAGGQAMGQAEQQWIRETMMVGSVALQTSEIALQKAQDEDVKQFAQFERDEQQTIAEVLRSMLEPAGTASTANPPQPDQQHAAMIQKLQQAKAGDAFDKEYIQGQLQGHQELLQIQERFLQGRPQNREAMNAAKLARGQIKEHLVLLKDIQEGL